MQLKIYSVRDSKAEVFNTPFFLNTHGEAERAFNNLVTDPKSMISKYPDDYDLYYVGEFNNDNGKLTLLDTPQHITKAAMLKSREHRLTKDQATSLDAIS